MNNKSYLIWAYATLLCVGGVIGFIKAGSLASLFISLPFALFLAWNGYRVFNGNLRGYTTTLNTLGSLLGVFAYRFFISYKMMPSGMMAIVTFALLSFLIWQKPALADLKSQS